jgi:hypothetical protein
MIDLARAASPGALAAELLGRSGARPPMRTFALSNNEHETWTSSFYGGWCDAEVHCEPFPVISLDVNSCFPLMAHLTGWWDLVCAERIERVDATERVVDVSRQLQHQPRLVLDPALWLELATTIVTVIPNGERWPVALEDPRRPDGRLEMTKVRTTGVEMQFCWPDVFGAAVCSDQPLRIERADAYRAIGRHLGVRRTLTVLPPLTVDLVRDPVLALVEHRRLTKGVGDRILAQQLRVVTNALVYGNFCRFDPVRIKVGGVWTNSERPGPWVCMPIASTVSAGSRLLLGLLEYFVRERGGRVIYRDTDSSLIPATPTGTERFAIHDGAARCLSYAEVAQIVASFAPLSPAPSWPVWEIKG